MFACSIHFHAGSLWKSNVKRRKSVLILLVKIEWVRGFTLEVTLERVCWPGKRKRERVLEDERIYRKLLSWSWLQKRGTKLICGRSFEHWLLGFPGQWVPKTEFLRVSAIFVPGTSGMTSVLNYRSVSPITVLLISTRLLRSAQGAWGDLLTSSNVCMKNSQKS